MRVKSKDVAKELGLSTATVSLAINNRPGVNEETRRRILEYIAQASKEASGNRKENAGIIRMLTFYEDRSYWDSAENDRLLLALEGATQRAREGGYKVDLVSIVRGRDSFASILSECKRDHVAGVLLGAAYMKEEDYQCFRDFKLPFVVCDQDFGDSQTDSIVLNNHQGVEAGLTHLYENGHRDIYYFRNSVSFYNMYERREAFNRFMERHGLQERRDERIIDIGGSVQEVYDGMQTYIRQKKHIPTAIFSENFEVTIGVIRALENNGLKLPEDVSMVGFGDIPDMALLSLTPTYIHSLNDRKAYIAVGRLIDRIEDRVEESVKIYVNTILMIGDSYKKIDIPSD